MDDKNWRPTETGEPTMDSGDWKSQLSPSSRERMVNKIMETLKRHLPVAGQFGLLQLRKIAVRFEEKVYADATNQSEYLHQISLKMLKMESKSQNPTGNSLAANSSGASNKPLESTANFKSGQPLSIPLSADQSQQRQQLLSRNIQNDIASQSLASLSPALPSVFGLTQNSIPNAIGQGTSMPNISGASQISLGNSAGQGVPLNIFANSQRQLQGKHQVPQTQQPQQQAQNRQYIYQQQLQQQILNQQGNMPPSLMPSLQEQQQSHQNILQPSQLQSSQQAGIQNSSVMHSSVMQPPVQQPNQAMLQQTGQSVLRQQQQAQQSAVLHQQQTTLQPQAIVAPQQQQPLTGQQSIAGNVQQNQLIGQQTAVGETQHKKQRLLGQQSNIPNLQQQQQLTAQQNNLSSMHQQQLGPQSNVSGLQRQLLYGNSGMQTNHPNVRMLQQNKVPLQQQAQQSASNILQPQGQQPQVQQPQHQLLPQILSQSAQLEQSLGLQHPNQLSRELQQRFQASGQVSGSLLQPQNVIDQQKQLYQAPRALPDTSSTSLDSTAQTRHAKGDDWQEEVYQKIKGMKEKYFHELSEMNQKITIKLQQHDVPQQPKLELLEKLKVFKTLLERLISFLQCPKSSIGPGIKEKLSHYEKQIVNILATNRPRKPAPSLQLGQLSGVHVHPMQQPQPQIMQVQSCENQMNSQIHSTNIQSNVVSLQQNLLASLRKAGTPLQSASSPFDVTSPSTPVAPSPIPGDSDKPVTGLPSLSNSGNIVHQQTSGIEAPAPSLAIGTPGMSASPLLAEFSGPDGLIDNTLATVSGKPSVTEIPLERLIRVIQSMSPSALSASVSDISSVVKMSDRIAGSTQGNGSRAAVGEDLVAMTKCRLQARNFSPLDCMSGTRKIKRYTSAIPFNVVSSTGSINDNFKQLTASEISDFESTATSKVKRHRFETNHAVLEEIKEINQRLIDTVVDVNEELYSGVAAAAAEGGDGTLVKCSFTAVALAPNLKSQYASAQMSPIQPLRLLVPSNYPNCSPVLLDKCLEDVKGVPQDLSAKVKSRFSISLRSLPQPMSLGEIARTWDVCVRAVVSEDAQQRGGGSLSTKYGSWENCLPVV